MSQFVKAVLFDLDGTLIDTAADFVRIIRNMSDKNSCRHRLKQIFKRKCLQALRRSYSYVASQ